MEEKKYKKQTFHQWVAKTFDWVDSDVKRYMQRAWTASNKATKKVNDQITKDNEEWTQTVVDRFNDSQERVKELEDFVRTWYACNDTEDNLHDRAKELLMN